MKVLLSEGIIWKKTGLNNSFSPEINILPSKPNETSEMASTMEAFLEIFMYPLPAWKEILGYLYKARDEDGEIALTPPIDNELGRLQCGNPICIIYIDFGEKIDILLEDFISIFEISIQYLEENWPFNCQ